MKKFLNVIKFEGAKKQKKREIIARNGFAFCSHFLILKDSGGFWRKKVRRSRGKQTGVYSVFIRIGNLF